MTDDVFVQPVRLVDPNDEHSKFTLGELGRQLDFPRITKTRRQILSSILWGLNSERKVKGQLCTPTYRFFMEQGQATLDIRCYPNVKDAVSVKTMMATLVEKGWLKREPMDNSYAEAQVFTAPDGSPLIVDGLKFVDVHYEKPLVMVKTKTKVEGYGAEYRSPDVRYMTKPEVKKKISKVFRPEMQKLNALVQSHRYSLSEDADPTMGHLDNSTCRLTRGFVGGFENHGGRLSAKYMHFKGHHRSHILIDGEATVEIDVVSCGIRLLAVVMGKTLPEVDDLYNYVDHPMPRNDKKLLVTALSNRGGLNKKRWPRNWQDNPEISPVIARWPYPEFREALLRAYPWFDEFDKDTNYALQIQWLESQSIIQAMRTVLNQGAGCLSVHESLIVPVAAKEIAKSAMISAFQDVAGITPVLAEK
jgi:hypothetical protein